LREDGEKNRDPLKIGLGKGLMESDKKDKKEWTYAKSRVTKRKKITEMGCEELLHIKHPEFSEEEVRRIVPRCLQPRRHNGKLRKR